jgi:hypothetical protein
MSIKSYVGDALLSLMCRLLFRIKVTEVMTGYKLFPKDIATLGELDVINFGFEIEVTHRILRIGYRIVEIPIHSFARR